MPDPGEYIRRALIESIAESWANAAQSAAVTMPRWPAAAQREGYPIILVMSKSRSSTAWTSRRMRSITSKGKSAMQAGGSAGN
jgi:hypothetical protein